MNYLKIIQETSRLSGLQGIIASVNGLVGEQADAKAFADDAYEEIQLFRDEWKFMKGTESVNLSDSLNTHSNSEVIKWLYILYDHRKLRFVDYETYLQQDWASSPSQPTMYTIVPETNQVITNDLDQQYTLSFRYIRDLHVMENQSDIPIIPLEYHRMIPYKAASNLAYQFGNDERGASSLLMFDKFMTKLLRNQNPSKMIKRKPFA